MIWDLDLLCRAPDAIRDFDHSFDSVCTDVRWALVLVHHRSPGLPAAMTTDTVLCRLYGCMNGRDAHVLTRAAYGRHDLLRITAQYPLAALGWLNGFSIRFVCSLPCSGLLSVLGDPMMTGSRGGLHCTNLICCLGALLRSWRRHTVFDFPIADARPPTFSFPFAFLELTTVYSLYRP